MTVNVWPAIVSVPWRVCVAVFAVAENVTMPPPVPLAPVLIVSHPGALLVAVHAQPAVVVTVEEPLPPPATIEALVGVIEYAQLWPDWVSVNVCPAIVSVPTR